MNDPRLNKLLREPKPIRNTHEFKDDEVLPNALHIQIGGDHYVKMKIQPVEYIEANNIPFIEGCVIKYLTRWRDKGGIKDLEKAKHYIDLLIEFEYRRQEDL